MVDLGADLGHTAWIVVLHCDRSRIGEDYGARYG